MRRAARPLLYLVTAATVLGLGKVHARYLGLYDFTATFRFGWSLAYVGLLCVAAYAVGLPDEPRDAYEALWSAIKATIAAAVGISLLALVRGTALLPRFVVFWSAAFLVPAWSLCCFVAARGRRSAARRDRVLAVLDRDEREAFLADLKMAPERRVALAGVLDVADAAGTPAGELPLVLAVREDQATIIVLDRAAQNDSSIVAQAALLHEHGIRIRTLSLFYEQWLGKLPISELERVSLLFDIGELHRSWYVRVKRLVDVVVAIVGYLVFLAVVPLVALGNLLGNRGSLLYRQERVGKAGATFEILKFRTMRRVDGEAINEWTTEDDPRITAFGRLLRRSHLDELPQVVNVLRGDLAMVGPRPEQTRYVDELVGKIPFYAVRHLVRPGITGWAQVKYGYAGNEVDALQKLQYEFFYLRHQSVALDVRIVARTIRSVVGAAGR